MDQPNIQTKPAFTTGELAQVCSTTVRTVQYYDSKGLLSPTERTEGGRRLYCTQDAEQLQFILMLKELGLSLAQIKGVLESPNRNTLPRMMLQEQEQKVQQELQQNQSQLESIRSLARDIDLFGKPVATTHRDMAQRMNDKKSQRNWRITAVVVGLIMDVAWIGTLVFGILKGIWWPFPIALIAVAIAAAVLVASYNAHASFICPACEAEFRPAMWPFFISRHTPNTRKLQCPHCHTKDWCVERWHAQKLSTRPGDYLSKGKQN